MDGRSRSLSVLTVAAVAIVALIVAVSFIVVLQPQSTNETSPFRINSDAEMVSSASRMRWPGNGSIDNPFIIDGLSLTTGSSAPCVYIGNTSYHFLLSHCVMNTTVIRMTSGQGIEFFNLRNGTIRNNTLINCSIHLLRCNSTRLYNNSIFALTLPIHISQCSGCLVLNNQISSRDQTALFEAVNNMQFENNTLSNPNTISMEMRSCSNNSLINNNMKGSLSLSTCFNNLIEKNQIQSISIPSVSSAAIRISGGWSNKVQGNLITGRGNGVELIDAEANQIVGNEIIEAENYGIILTNSANNTCISNALWGCHGSGSQWDPDHVQASDDSGSNMWNDSTGGNYWSDRSGAPTEQPYPLDGNAGAADLRPLSVSPII